LRGLAYFGVPEAPDLPGVPSLLDTYPNWNFSGAFLAVAPTKVPQNILERLRAAFDKVLNKPEVIEKLRAMGVSPLILSPEAAEKLIRKTHNTSAEIIHKANIRSN
jgi:tripartite-type tricarboxylate transporter receptor subunit TctC